MLTAMPRGVPGPPYPTARAFMPPRKTLPQLRAAAAGCRGCDLFLRATQTVFGAGPSRAQMLLVGEQPGDQEDQAGRPFVGPAGRVLDEALAAAGIERDEVYVTNVVKHFRWEQHGKRRLHAKPSSRQVEACLPWLEAEVAAVRPRLIVCLGATAAQALLGKSFRLTQHRGEILSERRWGVHVAATAHPSAVLRMPDESSRHAARLALEEDLRSLHRKMRSLPAEPVAPASDATAASAGRR
jgi:DNA polymerase